MAESILTRIGKAMFGDDGESLEKRAAVPTQTLGSSQLTAGDPATVMWAPDPTLSLVGSHRWDVFDDMVRDVSIVAAGVRLFLNLMANAVWTVNPPEGLNENEEAVAQGYADQAYDTLFDMTSSWAMVVRKVAMFRLMGFSIMEWTARRNPDGSIGFLDVEHRPQRTIVRWIRDPSGTITGVIQRVNGRDEVELPRGKIVYAVDDVLTDHPEGVGLFRHLVSSSERLKTFLELEEIGFVTDLRGIPIARAPLAEEQTAVESAGQLGSEARTLAEAKRKSKLQPLKDFVEKHVRNKKLGLLLPSDTYAGKSPDGGLTPSDVPKWAVELLNGDSSAFDSMHQAVNRMNQELALVLGVEHLLLGSDGTGSLALARSKVGTFYLTVTSTLQDLVEIFDRDLIAPLAELNGWPDELRPQMGVNEISDRDVEQVALVLRNMALAGAVLEPDDPAIGEMRDMVGLSRPPEREAEDLSLVPGRREPRDPDKPTEEEPEPGAVAKSRLIRTRKRRVRKAAAGR